MIPYHGLGKTGLPLLHYDQSDERPLSPGSSLCDWTKTASFVDVNVSESVLDL